MKNNKYIKPLLGGFFGLVIAGASIFLYKREIFEYVYSTGSSESERMGSNPPPMGAAHGGPTPDRPGNTDEMPNSASTQKIVVVSPLESGLVTGNSLNAEAADKLLRREDFDAVIDRLALQSNADGVELTKLYQKSLSSELKSRKSRFGLDRLACGTNVCAAVFSGTGNDDRFSEVMDVASESGSPMYSASIFPIPPNEAGGKIVYRVIFANDPKFNSITVPRSAFTPGG
ncbi:MAG: hypothetical protein IT473_03215 [Lysobacter sp.]|nr:hypothetical protein [Lysobacter sp.]